MAIISSLTTYFSHSNYGKHQLKKDHDQRGIQSGGATRFSTFATHANSISHCFGAIERCLSSGTIKFDTKAVCTLFLLSQGGFEVTFQRQHLSGSTLRPALTHLHFGGNCIKLTCF